MARRKLWCWKFTIQFNRNFLEILIEWKLQGQGTFYIFLTFLSLAFTTVPISEKVLNRLLVEWQVCVRLVKPNDGGPWMTRWCTWPWSYQQQKDNIQYTCWQVSLLWGSLNIFLASITFPHGFNHFLDFLSLPLRDDKMTTAIASQDLDVHMCSSHITKEHGSSGPCCALCTNRTNAILTHVTRCQWAAEYCMCTCASWEQPLAMSSQPFFPSSSGINLQDGH